LLKKAVTVFKSKTGALRTKLLVMASLRGKMAMVRAVSHRIHALVSSDWEKQARLEYGNETPLVLAAAGVQEPAVEGLEFNLDDEIDQACDMFIRRFRKRMNRSF
ncbi:hypothetical protein BAE44_0019595, partial [Dichanthelium oligosanthes]